MRGVAATTCRRPDGAAPDMAITVLALSKSLLHGILTSAP
jgi:hypothetical protein